MPTFLNRLLCLAGVGLVLLGLCLPWFQVPMGISGPDRSVVVADSPVTLWLKLACGILLVAGCLACGRHFQARRRWVASTCASLLMVAGLLPYLTMTRCVEVSRQATWMEMQHRNLTWLGGDIYNGMEYRFMANKSKVLAVDTPRVLRAMPLLDRPLSEVGLADASNVFQWLGLTPAFTEFVSRGWFLVLAGAFVALLGSLAHSSGQGFVDLSILKRLSIYGSVQVLVALGVVAASGQCLMQARQAVDNGDYPAADVWMLRAQQLVPVLVFDSDMLLQRGLCHHANGLETRHAKLYRASMLERQGFSQQSSALYEELAREQENGAAYQVEAHRALLRHAINDFNSNNVIQASQTLDYLRALYPAHLKILYTRQLAALSMHEPATLKSLHDDLLGLYHYIQSPNKRAVIAASHEHLLGAAIVKNDVEEMARHHAGMVRGK